MPPRSPHELSHITTSGTRTSEPQGLMSPQTPVSYKSGHLTQNQAQSIAARSLGTTQPFQIARRTMTTVSGDTRTATSHAKQYLPEIRDVDPTSLSYPCTFAPS